MRRLPSFSARRGKGRGYVAEQAEMFKMEPEARQAQAAREADHGGRLYGKSAQAPCDIGLFSANAKQRDFFDL